jgi:CheY-like chemotaxis protein
LPADKILIVDDDKFNLELIGAYIDSFGYEYDVAEDGEEAVQKTPGWEFNQIIRIAE